MEERISIAEGVEVHLDGETIKVKGPNGEVSKKLAYPGVKISKSDGEIIVKVEQSRRAQKAIAGTFASHIRNLIKGVSKGFEYKMKIVYSHFPITVKVSGKDILVENYLGEKIPRRTKIAGSCTVKVHGNEVTVFGKDVEEVGQTAANIEQLTRVRKKDPRVFQDGIYLVERDGVSI